MGSCTPGPPAPAAPGLTAAAGTFAAAAGTLPARWALLAPRVAGWTAAYLHAAS